MYPLDQGSWGPTVGSATFAMSCRELVDLDLVAGYRGATARCADAVRVRRTAARARRHLRRKLELPAGGAGYRVPRTGTGAGDPRPHLHPRRLPALPGVLRDQLGAPLARRPCVPAGAASAGRRFVLARLSVARPGARRPRGSRRLRTPSAWLAGAARNTAGARRPSAPLRRQWTPGGAGRASPRRRRRPRAGARISARAHHRLAPGRGAGATAAGLGARPERADGSQIEALLPEVIATVIPRPRVRTMTSPYR